MADTAQLSRDIGAIVVSDYAILPDSNPTVEKPEYIAAGVLRDGRSLTVIYHPQGEAKSLSHGSRLEISLVPMSADQEGFMAELDLTGMLRSFSFLSGSGPGVEIPGYLISKHVAFALRKEYEWLLGFAHYVLTERAFRHEAAYSAAKSERAA